MKDTNPVYLHIGLCKTGNTWLQKQLFPKLSVDIISNDHLSGEPVSSYPVEYSYILLYGLKEMYPNASIILGIRDVDSWLRSVHSEYVKRSGCRSFDDWYKNMFDSRVCDFDSYICELKKLFDDRVFIYRFEDFKKDKQKVIKDMCAFIGCDIPEYEDKIVNRGLYGNIQRMGIFVNRCRRKILWLLYRL